MFNKVKATCAAIAMLGSVSANASLVIDNFQTPSSPISVVDSTPDAVGSGWATQSGLGILGGERDIFVFERQDQFGVGEVKATVGNGYYSFVAGSGVNGYGRIRWDGAGVGNSAVGLGNLDFAALGSAVNLNVLFSDANFPFSLALYTSNSQYSLLTLAAIGTANPLPGDPDNHTPYNRDISLSLFQGAPDPLKLSLVHVGGGADLSKINAVEAFVNFLPNENDINGSGIKAVDLTIGQATLVPEPASIALLGLGLLGVGFSRRSKKD